jgi:hypothetical protein
MLLELGRAMTFFLSIASLYAVATNAFFTVSSHWSDRLVAALLHLMIAACVCFGSGLLFAYPGDRRLSTTPPVKLFLWTLAVLPLIFFAAWYISCGNPLRVAVNLTCG